MDRDFKLSKQFNGWCTLLSVVAGIPLFFFSDKILSQITHHKLMAIAQLLFAVCLLLQAAMSLSFHASSATTTDTTDNIMPDTTDNNIQPIQRTILVASGRSFSC